MVIPTVSTEEKTPIGIYLQSSKLGKGPPTETGFYGELHRAPSDQLSSGCLFLLLLSLCGFFYTVFSLLCSATPLCHSMWAQCWVSPALRVFPQSPPWSGIFLVARIPSHQEARKVLLFILFISNLSPSFSSRGLPISGELIRCFASEFRRVVS